MMRASSQCTRLRLGFSLLACFDFSPVAETEWLKQDAYGVANARVAYSSAAGGFEVGVWCRNLTDSAYYEDAVVQSASSRVSYADPRAWGIEFKLRL